VHARVSTNEHTPFQSRPLQYGIFARNNAPAHDGLTLQNVPLLGHLGLARGRVRDFLENLAHEHDDHGRISQSHTHVGKTFDLGRRCREEIDWICPTVNSRSIRETGSGRSSGRTRSAVALGSFTDLSSVGAGNSCALRQRQQPLEPCTLCHRGGVSARGAQCGRNP